MSLDVRVTVYSATMGSVLCLDAYSAGDLYGGAITYEDTPSGCGSGKVSLGLTYEEVINRGYYRGLNIVEISTGDNTLKTSASAGANKYYLDTTWGFDPAQGEDAQQAYFYDGATLTMRVPVLTVGSDGGGSYITTSAPLGGGSVPAYAAGTIVGRRRYTGRILRRSIAVQRTPGGVDIQLTGLQAAFAQALGTFTISAAANVDVGSAIYNSISQFASTHWPFFGAITSGNFPTTGSTYHGTLTNVGCDRLISDALQAITSADQWFVRVGHDRIPRLIKLFTESSNTYTYNVTLAQGSTEYEPVSLAFEDEDSSNIFNTILVTGDTDGTTGQPAAAIVEDTVAASLVGYQIDGSPISNLGIKDVTGASNYGLGQVDQYALPTASNQVLVYTKNDTVTGTTPGSMKNGDVLRASACLTVTGFDQVGLVPNWTVDSGIAYGSGTSALWTTSGSATSVDVGASPDGLNAWSIGALVGGTAQTVAVPCQPGQLWTFTGYINAGGASGGSGSYDWILVDVTHNVTIALVTRSTGSGTPTAVTATIPAGCTQIAMRAYVGAHTGATGSVIFAQPNLNFGSTIQPYAVNYAAPNVLGLPTSIVTTIDLDKQDTQQQATFNAIEPSFSAFVAEAANAVSNQLRANVVALNAIDQYCVSTNARNYTTSTSSLIVGFPAFLAQFAPGSTLISIATANVTLTANATNWVWLLSTGSYSVTTTATPTQGAILIGIFQCNASGVMGSVFKASVGVFQVGVGNVNAAANLPAPTFSGATVANGNSLNGMAADITASVTLTNVPTTGPASQVQWYFRQTGGSGTWIPYEGQNLAIAGGSLYPTNPQTVNFEYGDMTNGVQYDLGIGYVGFAGYGPVTVFQSAWTAKTIAITAPYLYAGSTPTPTVSGATATNGTSGNGIAADVIVAFTTTNQPTDASLSRIAIWVRVSSLGGSNTIGGTGFAWSPYGSQPAQGVGSASPGASYTYSMSLADLTNGQTYDFGISYENNQGGESIIGVVVSNFTAQALNLPTTGNAAMNPTIATNGPNITAGVVGTITASGSGSCLVPITFSIGDWALNAQPGWFSGFVFYYRVHGTTTFHQDALLGVTGAVSGITMSLHIPAASIVDIGIAYEGAQSVQSAIAWSSYFASITTPGISPPASIAGTGSPNLVPDGQLAHILSSANEAYWAEYLIDGVSFSAIQGNSTQPFGLFNWTSGANSSTRYANSQPFTLQSGQAYTMSAYLDLINATGTGGCRVIGPVSGAVTNTNPANAATAIGSVLKAGGSAGVFSTTFTPTTTGKYVFQVSNSGITIGGSPIFMGQFQVEIGSAFTGFKNNTPAQTDPSTPSSQGTTAHAAASAQTQATITATAGAEGSFLASATVARRSIAGNTTFNFIFNPTAAQNTLGWTTTDATAHATFSRDTQWGGRFILTIPSGTLAGSQAYYAQNVIVVASTSYTVSGNIYCNALPTGGYVNVQVGALSGALTGTTNFQLTVAAGVLTPFSFTFTTNASCTGVQLALVANAGGTSPSSATSAAWSSLKLEYGTVSTPHSDDTTTSLVTTTHQQTPGVTDNSNLLPNIVSARHMIGAPVTDQGPVMDSGGLVLYTRHATPVKTTIASTAGSDGIYLATGAVARRQTVNPTGSNLVFNPTGRTGTNGWTIYNGTGTGSYGHDNYLGGRLYVSAPYASSYSPNQYVWLYQTVPAFANATYTLSGEVEMDGSAGANVCLDVYDNLLNYYYTATQSGTSTGQVPVSTTFTTVAGVTTLTIRLRLTMVAGTGSATGYFYGVSLEQGSVASPFVDHTATALVGSTHQATAGAEGSYLASGQIGTRHIVGSSLDNLSGTLQSKNLVVNGNNTGGAGTVTPTTFGWLGTFGSFSSFVNAGNYLTNDSFQLNGTLNCGVYQDVPCVPGATYTFQFLNYTGTAAYAPGLFIGSADGAYTQFNGSPGNPTPYDSSGDLPPFYSGASVSGNSWYQNGYANEWAFNYGTFTVPSGYTKMRVMLYNSHNGGVATSCFYQGVMVTRGTRLQDYIDHELGNSAVVLGVHATNVLPFGQHASAITGVINSSGQIPSSAALVPQSSTLPTVSNLAIVSTPYSSATSYGNYGSGTPLPTYSKIVASWSAATVYFPSGATLAIAAGSQTFYVAGLGSVDPLNHLLPNTSYYVNAWVSENSSNLNLFYTPNALQINEAAAIFADGLVSVSVNNGPVTTPVQPGSGSSTGGSYTPPPPTCPAVGQIVQTKRGFVRAEEIVVGDELLDWDDGVYNVVHKVKRVRSEIFRVVAGTEAFRVDRDHLWVVAKGKLWWPTWNLKVGDALTSADGGEDIVTEIKSLGDGEFIGIDCDRHRFRIGRLIAHNMVTVEGH